LTVGKVGEMETVRKDDILPTRVRRVENDKAEVES
jgi:hypothetical protein